MLASLLTPAKALRLRYLPLLAVYFAYGALGLIDVSRDMWIKESLTVSAAELAGFGVWLSLPWTLKMVVGALADSVPILGSQRRSYILIGAACIAAGLTIPAGWEAVGKSGPKPECLEHIKEVWTDMRPRSLREAMGS